MSHRSLLLVGLLLTACSTDPEQRGPTSIAVLNGPAARGIPGWYLADTIRIRLSDSLTEVVRAGELIEWTASAGGEAVPVDSLSDLIDQHGVSAVRWRLGSQGLNRLTARLPDGAVQTFEVDATAFRAEAFASSTNSACGTQGSRLYCWGPAFWKMGTPVSDGSWTGDHGPWRNFSPGLIDSTRAYSQLATTEESVCGLQEGAVFCATPAVRDMHQIAGLPSLRTITANNSTWSGYIGMVRPPSFCGISASDSTAWCWNIELEAAPLPGSPALKSLATESGDAFGNIMRCGIKADSLAVCWRRGFGSPDTSTGSWPVNGSHRFWKVLVNGAGSACGITATQELWCWSSSSSIPTLIRSGILDAAFVYRDVVLRTVAGLNRTSLQNLASPMYGLTGLPLGPLADNASCLQVVTGEIYCNDDYWNQWDWLWDNYYSPTPPVRD